jgi:hypothetical protein
MVQENRPRRPKVPYLNNHKTQPEIIFDLLRKRPMTTFEIETATGLVGGASRRLSELLQSGCVRVVDPNAKQRVYEVVPGTSIKKFHTWSVSARSVRTGKERERRSKLKKKTETSAKNKISQKAFLALCKASADALRSESPMSRHMAMAAIEEAIIASF